MKKNKKPFKLKYLKAITGNTVDYKYLMKDAFYFKENKFFNKLFYKYCYLKAYKMFNGIKDIDLTKVEFKKDCSLKHYLNIDDLPYIAYLELQATLSGNHDFENIDLVANVVAKACFKEYFKNDYDSLGNHYKTMVDIVLETDIESVFGLYNKIIKDVTDSNSYWEEKFVQVMVDDPDYDQANQGIMSQFNIIETLKSLCSDFNCTLNEAWQFTYSTVQTNNLSKSSRNFVQDRLRLIKEEKMKANRSSH